MYGIPTAVVTINRPNNDISSSFILQTEMLDRYWNELMRMYVLI